MKVTLCDINWISILDLLNTIDDVWLLFKSTLQEIIDKYIPTYKLKERKNLYTVQEAFNLKRKKNKL